MTRFIVRFFISLLTLVGGLSQATAASLVNGPAMGSARHFHSATLLGDGRLLVAGGTGLATAEIFTPNTGKWSPTADMNINRQHHTATLLPNGKVLVAGGQGLDSPTSPILYRNSAELYDPTTGIWTITGSLNSARTDHTATLLANGKVLVTGGRASSNTLNSAELYDPVSGTWTKLGATLATARDGHTATLLANGWVLITGGNSAVAAELLNPNTNTFAVTGVPQVARRLHTAVLLPNGKVMVAGGQTGGTTHSSVELYDPATGKWSQTGFMIFGRHSHSCTLLPNGRVLVTGGYGFATLTGAETYDPATGTWSTAGTLAIARNSHTATLLASGRVILIGGWSENQAVSSTEIYQDIAGAWTPTNSLAVVRYGHTQTLLPNGSVLVVGGLDRGTSLNSSELYNPVTSNWAVTGSITTGRANHTATLLRNGKVMVAGGSRGSTNLATIEIYDPTTGVWSAAASMAYPRSSHSATLLPDGMVLVAGGGGFGSKDELYNPTNGTWTAIDTTRMPTRTTATLLPNGKLLAVGGNRGSAQFDVDLFDPVTKEWSPTTPLNFARHDHTATLLPEGKVLVTGGGDGSGAKAKYLSSTEVYDPLTGLWTVGPSLSGPRLHHNATLLPNGMVLVSGGSSGNGYLATAEIYDPTTSTWSPAASLGTSRGYASATLLTSGKVLVVAGVTQGGNLASAELFEPIGGVDPSWKPTISSMSPLMVGSAFSMAGTKFRGISEGSSGDQRSSPADHPIVQLRSLTSDQIFVPRATTWSATSIAADELLGLPAGWVMASVTVNGITGPATIVKLSASNNADLGSLALSAGILSPAFISSTSNYTATVGYAVDAISVTAGVAEKFATMKVRINGGAYIPIGSGAASSPLILGPGANTVEVQVTAPDATTVKTYTIVVTRKSPAMTVKLDGIPRADDFSVALDFGHTPVGESVVKEFEVTNSGSDTLTIGSLTVDGMNSADFQVSGPVLETLEPNEQTTFTVTFHPASLGKKFAVVHLTNNLTGTGNPFDMKVTGAGNTPPVFNGYAFSTPYQKVAMVAPAKLLAKASDADGDALSVSVAGPSQQGGTVVWQSGMFLYTPPIGFSGTDTFQATVRDAPGATVAGTVSVTVGPNPTAGNAGVNPPVLTLLPDGKRGISFHGIPGRTYIVQRSAGGLDHWVTLTSIVAARDGRVEFTDDEPPPGSAFYRLGLP